MAKGELIVGLDIGTTKICTLIAEIRDGDGAAADRLHIVGVGSAPSIGVRKGVVVDIDETAKAIRVSVDMACRMAGADIHSAIIGVSGEHIASVNSRGIIPITHPNRQVTGEDVERVLENSRGIVLPPDREIIHALPRGYAIDGQNGIRSPVGMSGTRLEVETHIVTGATTFLRNVATCVERADLHIEEMVLEPLATSEAVLLDAERALGVALLDIGGGTSDLAIFRGGDICYTAVIPVGGEYITRDISAGLRVSHDEAERVKITCGSTGLETVGDSSDGVFTFTRLGTGEEVTLPLADLSGVIEPRAHEIFHLVIQELNRSGFAGHLPAGLVLSGGGALLTGLRQLAESVTGLPTRIAHPRSVAGLADPTPSPSLATGLGLLRWGAQAHAVAHARRAERSGGLLGSLGVWFRRVVREVFGH